MSNLDILERENVNPESYSDSEPTSLCCPISGMMFRDPVIVVDTGYTYERECILRHFKKNLLSDPITGEKVTGEIQVNRTVRDSVAEWIKANAGIAPRGWDGFFIPDPDSDHVTQKLDYKLSIQTSKWRQLRSRLRSLCCEKMPHSPIILTNESKVVKEIHLSGLNLSDIPQEIYDFSYLEALYIDNNNIRCISPKIANLKNLRILNAANNNINYVPKEILKLKSLHILNLANNDLKELPDNMHSFRELRELRVENNKLTDIDLDLKRNQVLCRLFVHGNQLDTDKFSDDMGILKG